MWFLLASLAHGGEIQVVPLVPIEIIVDGLPVPMDANGVTMTVAGLAGGKHTVEARNAFGKTQAWKEVDLAADEQLRFEYRQKELWHVATTKLVAAPLAVAASSEVVVVQPGMPGAGVSIAVDDGMGGSVVMGADAWGGGVVVDDGRGGRVVVQGGAVPPREIVVVDRQTQQPYVVERVPPRGVVYPMAAGPFEALVAAIEAGSFSSDKQSVLATAAAHNHFTCAQMVRLLRAFDFESDRLDALKASRHAVIDPQNAFQLAPAFDFSSSMEEAQALFR